MIALIILSGLFYLSYQYLNETTFFIYKERLIVTSLNFPLLFFFAYVIIYTISAALSLPGAFVLTLLGGMIFDTTLGTIIVSFASTIGATLAFLLARYSLKDKLERKYSSQLRRVNLGVEKDGDFYLFALRMVPLFPFFMLNALFGLTSMSTKRFFWISQLGMLPATFLYVKVGTELAKVNSLNEVMSVRIVALFSLIGVLPLLLKKLVSILRRKK